MQIDFQNKQKELYDQQTRDLRQEVLQEQREQREQLEKFLERQQEDLEKKMGIQSEKDPSRVLEIKKKAQYIKIRARGQMLITSKFEKNWQKNMKKDLK